MTKDSRNPRSQPTGGRGSGRVRGEQRPTRTGATRAAAAEPDALGRYPTVAEGGLVFLAADNRRTRRERRRALRRLSYRYRHQLVPVVAAGLVAAAGGVLRFLGTGSVPVALSGLLLESLLAMFGRRAFGRRIERLYAGACIAAITAWLILAVRVGPLGWVAGVPLPTLLTILTAVLGWPWWQMHAVDYSAAPPEDLLGQEDPEYIWDEFVGQDGGLLPGSYLTDIAWGDHGWEGGIRLVRGKQTYETAIRLTDMLTSAFDKEIGSVIVEPPANGRSTRAKIAVYNRNPLHLPLPWAGPQLFDVGTGTAWIGRYADFDEVPYSFWRKNFGPVHDLIAGATGSGKSRLLDQLLAYERHAVDPLTGRRLITSIVLDPQGGQSLPDWRGQVAAFASGITQCMQMLYAIREAMYARSAYMSSVAWVDEKGREREGRQAWLPDASLPPLLSVTIDEAHILCKIPEGAKLLEEIALMARKAGVRLRIVVQVPLLDQLGGSETLRSQVGSGNVIVLRTSSPITTHTAFHGTAPGDPSRIPQVFENYDVPLKHPDRTTTTAGLGFVAGSALRQSMMRLYSIPDLDVYDWATLGDTEALNSLDLSAGGPYWQFSGPVGDGNKPLLPGAWKEWLPEEETTVITAPTLRPAGGDSPDVLPPEPSAADAGLPTLVLPDGKKLSASQTRILLELAGQEANTSASREQLMIAAGGIGPRAVNQNASALVRAGLLTKPAKDTYVLHQANWALLCVANAEALGITTGSSD